jgi:hypothetical protein
MQIYYKIGAAMSIIHVDNENARRCGSIINIEFFFAYLQKNQARWPPSDAFLWTGVMSTTASQDPI